MPRNISPRRNLAPPPLYVPLPDAVGIKDPAVASTLNSVIKQLNAVANYVRQQTTAPSLAPPTGPTSPSVTPGAGSTHVVQFYSDSSGPNVNLYRVWRAPAGTRGTPTDPGPDSAVCVGTVVPSRIEDGSLHRHLEREFSITDMDPANPARFKYWVTSIDDRGIESAFVEASGGPIETLTNGPGDQSPELKHAVLNKLIYTGAQSQDFTQKNIDQPYAITASTNATPIVVTIGAHTFAVGDLAFVDGHAVNTNANGVWRVSATGPTTITLQSSAFGNSIGNGVGGATGKVYRHDYLLGGLFPPITHAVSPVANGAIGNYVQPNPKNAGGLATENALCCYIPWYSEQATLAIAGSNGPSWILNPAAAGASVAISQEVGIRKFSYPMRLSMSAYVANSGVPTDSDLKFEVMYEDGTALFSNTWHIDTFMAAPQRFVFTFRLSSVVNTTKNRLKFRISNVNNSGTGVTFFLSGIIVNGGDHPASWTSVTDGSDYTAPGVDYPDWSRPVSQTIARDASAPYA